MNKCPYEIPRIQWTDDSVVLQDIVDNMAIKSFSKCSTAVLRIQGLFFYRAE